MPKWIIKYTTEKTLGENLDDDFYKLGFRKAFWSIIAKPETIKKKTDKSDYTKIDSSSAKQQEHKVKRQRIGTFTFSWERLNSITSTPPLRTQVKLNFFKNIYLEASDFQNHQELQAVYPRKDGKAWNQFHPHRCPLPVSADRNGWETRTPTESGRYRSEAWGKVCGSLGGVRRQNRSSWPAQEDRPVKHATFPVASPKGSLSLEWGKPEIDQTSQRPQPGLLSSAHSVCQEQIKSSLGEDNTI